MYLLTRQEFLSFQRTNSLSTICLSSPSLDFDLKWPSYSDYVTIVVLVLKQLCFEHAGREWSFPHEYTKTVKVHLYMTRYWMRYWIVSGFFFLFHSIS